MGKLGFIGLGIMGRPMAENLLKGGQQVMVSDLNEAVVEELRKQGAESGSCTDLAKACDIIFTILPTGAIVQEVLFGENGVASALRPGQVVCDMSSVTPGESQTCYRRLKELGVGFVDARSPAVSPAPSPAPLPSCAAATRRISTG